MSSLTSQHIWLQFCHSSWLRKGLISPPTILQGLVWPVNACWNCSNNPAYIKVTSDEFWWFIWNYLRDWGQHIKLRVIVLKLYQPEWPRLAWRLRKRLAQFNDELFQGRWLLRYWHIYTYIYTMCNWLSLSLIMIIALGKPTEMLRKKPYRSSVLNIFWR